MKGTIPYLAFDRIGFCFEVLYVVRDVLTLDKPVHSEAPLGVRVAMPHRALGRRESRAPVAVGSSLSGDKAAHRGQGSEAAGALQKPSVANRDRASGAKGLSLQNDFRKGSKARPPSGILTRERRAPIRLTIVTNFDLWIGASALETSLRLVTHDDHKLGTLARFRTQRLI